MPSQFKPSIFLLACFLGDIFFNALQAKDLGTQGYIFPIEEENLQQYLQRQLAGKMTLQDQQSLIQCLLNFVENPSAIAGIQHTSVRRSFLIDPTYEAKSDIFGPKKTLIVRKGTRINPLDHIVLSSGLLFIDGDAEDQILWARQQKGAFKWVLVKGHPLQLENQEKRPIYFDQQGFYTTKFHIEQVPARVVQKGNRLLVEEIPLHSSEQGKASS